MAITDRAPQLLLTFEYDQEQLKGTPFSIAREEIDAHYGADYDVTLLGKVAVPGGLKRQVDALEAAWMLRDK